MINSRTTVRGLLVALALILAACAPSTRPAAQTTQQVSPTKEAAPNPNLVTVLNPLGKPPPIPLKQMAPRSSTLDGKTVYLVDVRFMDGDRFLKQMQAWFAKNMPKVKTVYVQKDGSYAYDDTSLWEQIKADGAAVIMAIGH
jgi:hypothetical protein